MDEDKILTFRDLTIKTDAHEVYRNHQRIQLRKKEYELLEFLARNKGRVVNKLTILEYVWNYSAQAATNTLDVHMAALRRKIDSHSSIKLIRTIHGLGYKLSDRP